MATRAVITSNRAKLNEVQDVNFTETWKPYHHNDVMDSVEYALRAEGLEIREESFTLTQQGLNMFAVLVLNRKIGDDYWQIGIRNSMNKMFRVGMCAGKRVTVCSNLMFAGEFTTMHKHTARLDYTKLKVMAIETLDSVKFYCDKLHTWSEGLRTYYLNADNFKQVVYDCIDCGVMPPSKFTEFHEVIEKNQTEEQHSLYDIHDTITRMNRNKSYFQQYDSCKRLNTLMTEYQYAEAA